MTDSAIALQAVTEGRALAEELMVDECIIETGVAGLGTFDSDTGVYTPRAGTVVYDGPCQVQIAGAVDASTPDVGEGRATLQRLGVKVPVAAAGIEIDQVVTITATGEASDPALVGRQLRITATHAKTYATARRLQCEEVTG